MKTSYSDWQDRLADEIIPAPTPEEIFESARAQSIKGYRTKTIVSGPYVEIEVYPYYKRGQRPKLPPAGPSTAAMRKANDRKAAKQVERLANANFKRGDTWLTLTYSDHCLPATIEDAGKQLVNYLRRVKRAAAKAGTVPAKYIYVTERYDEDGQAVRIHHHLLLNNCLSRDDIESLWHNGRTQARKAQPDENGFAGMATYITKTPAEGARRWGTSRNLKAPVVRVTDRKASRAAVQRALLCQANLDSFFLKLIRNPARKAQLHLAHANAPRHNPHFDGVFLSARFIIIEPRPCKGKKGNREYAQVEGKGICRNPRRLETVCSAK